MTMTCISAGLAGSSRSLPSWGYGPAAVQRDALTDSLTRQAEAGETQHDAGDGDQPCALGPARHVGTSETRKRGVVVLITQRLQVQILPSLLAN
jgi:hypothetical protein